MGCSRVFVTSVVFGFFACLTTAVGNNPPHLAVPDGSVQPHAGHPILVPQVVMETRQIVCVENRPQLITKKVPVTKRVPMTTMQKRCTVRLIQKKFTQTVCRQETAPEDSTSTICVTKMVPQTEKKTGMRKVTKQVPVLEKRIVCEDLGHWEPCGCTCACTKCQRGECCGKCPKRRWVSKPVERVVEVTVMKSQCFEEPYEYEVTRMKPTLVKRQLTLREYGHAKKVTEEREFTVLVPECVQETVAVATCRCYTDYEEKKCTIMVPVKVIKEVQVPVCRMVRVMPGGE